MDTEAYGYIRQSSPLTHPLIATPAAKFYLLDEASGWAKVEVDIGTYKNRMTSALENNETIWLFASVTFSGENIIQIEMVYRP